jgi:probable rRNA maturation factor
MEDSEQSSSLDIRGLPSDLRTLRPLVEKAGRVVMAEHEVSTYAVSISFVKDDAITEINRKSLGRSGPTDVIAFDLSEEGLPFQKVGDIYISVETATRNSRSYEVSLEEELVRLVVHGMLHLVGFVDEPAAERRCMEEAQERLVGELLARSRDST